jgi:hypothetical protein
MNCVICGADGCTCKGLSPDPQRIIDIPKREARKAMWTSTKRLYLDQAGNVVGAKDPNRHTLLVAEGGRIPTSQARELGLLEPIEVPAPEAEPDAEPENEAEKAEEPIQDKAEKPARNKSARSAKK